MTPQELKEWTELLDLMRENDSQHRSALTEHYWLRARADKEFQRFMDRALP